MEWNGSRNHAPRLDRTQPPGSYRPSSRLWSILVGDAQPSSAMLLTHFTHSLTGSFLRAEMLDAARLHNNALLARGRTCSPILHRATKGRPPAFRSESEPPSAHACTRLVFVTHGHMPATDISYPWGRILLIVYLSIVEQLHDHSSTYWSCSHSQLRYLLSHCTTTTPGQ